MHENRNAIGLLIAEKIATQLDQLKTKYESAAPIHHFYVDDLLPIDLANKIRNEFPSANSMSLLNTMRELKFISAQMNKHNPILEEVIFAFQHPSVVKLIEKITGLRELEPDELLYAGGISMMGKNHFLNPHLDNSHDKSKDRYRVLNLLYYTSPNWVASNGGNLELWPNGPKNNQITIENKFNRLVVMVTNKSAWHSVSKIVTDDFRCCISNYYFSKYPADDKKYFHVTSYRGRPEEPIKDIILRFDSSARLFLRKIFPSGIRKITHYYKK